MSRLYDTVEPSVISEELLQAAVEEQGPKAGAAELARAEGIDWAHVRQLRLDFKNILKIDHLWCFVNLVKLQLDNNIIERIEGLDCLTNLVWLDLSFNNIEVIEGLDRLTKIQDLSLYNNRIQRLENMDTLAELNVFSVGNNDLQDLKNMVYLRRFEKLQTLNVTGNPVCQLEDYQIFIVGHLPHLEYLDYRLIDKKLKASAYEKYDTAIQEMQSKEKLTEVRKDEETNLEKELKLHKEAYVENLNGPQLFDSMYAEDAEGKLLAKMPGMPELVANYRENFTALCQQMFEVGLQKHEERRLEIEDFLASIDEAKIQNSDQAAAKLQAFREYKAKVWHDLNEMLDQSSIDVETIEYHRKIGDLWDALMNLEMQLADQIDETVALFERNLAELVDSFVDSVRGLMSACRDLENQHNERVLELSMATMDRVNKGDLDDDTMDDLRELFVDKDTVTNAIAASHDTHLLKIDGREDDLFKGVLRWQATLIADTTEREVVRRNRQRVVEICHIIDYLRDEIDSIDFTTPN